MSEPVQSEDVSHIEPPPKEAPPEVQPNPVSESPIHEPTTESSKVEGVPNQGPFAEGLPKPEGRDPGEIVQGQRSFQERQSEPSEQPKPIPVEKLNPEQPQDQPQPRPNEAESNFAAMTPAPVSPGANQDENPVEHSLSALGASFYVNRRALQLRSNEGAVEKNE